MSTTRSIGVKVGFRQPPNPAAPQMASAEKREQQLEILLGRAYFEFEQGNYTNAAALARYCVKTHGSVDGKKILATAAHSIGDNETANAFYPEAINAYPDDLNLIVGFAELCLDQSRFSEAAKLIERALELDPNSAHPAGAKARLLVLRTKRLAH